MRKDKDESEISSLASGAGDADESLQDGDQEGEVLKKKQQRDERSERKEEKIVIFQEIIEEPLNVPLYRLKLDNVDKCNKQISAEIVLEFFNQIQWFQYQPNLFCPGKIVSKLYMFNNFKPNKFHLSSVLMCQKVDGPCQGASQVFTSGPSLLK